MAPNQPPVKRLTVRQVRQILESLTARGFDNSYITTGGVKVSCSQCSAVTINGHACHERGCPNVRKSTPEEE